MLASKKIIKLIYKPKLLLLAFVLLLASFGTQQWHNSVLQPAHIASLLQQDLNQKEKQCQQIAQTLSLLKNEVATNQYFDSLQQLNFGVFLYTIQPNNQFHLLKWNSNSYVNNNDCLFNTDTIFTTHNDVGYFVICNKQIKANEQLFLLQSIIPIKWDYFIKNDYLHSHFAAASNIEKYYDIVLQQTETPIKSIAGSAVYYLKKSQIKPNYNYDAITICLRLLSLLLLSLWLNKFCVQLSSRLGFLKGFSLLFATLLSTRFISYNNLNLLFNTKRLALFDPSIYATSLLHPSLGDLLINLLLTYWLLNFYFTHKPQRYTHKPSNNWLTLVLSCLLISTTTFVVNYFIKSFVVDSKISFDVSNFFNLNIYSGIALFTIGLLCVIFFQISKNSLTKIIQIQQSKFVKSLFYIAIVSICSIAAYYLFDLSATIAIAAFFWILIYTFFMHLLSIKNKDANRKKLLLPFAILVIYATSAAGLLLFYLGKLELEQRKRIAEKIYLQTDIATESLVNISAKEMSAEYIFNNRNKFVKNTRSAFADSLIAANFSGYLNKYSSSIFLFDANDSCIYTKDASSLLTLQQLLHNSLKPVDAEGMYAVTYLNNVNYILRKEICSSQSPTVYLMFVLLQPKATQSNTVFPQIFKQWQDVDELNDYSYALYDSSKLKEQHGSFNFYLQLEKYAGGFTNYTNATNKILIYQPNNYSDVVVVKSTRELLDFLTLSAYFLFSLLILSWLLTANYYEVVNIFKKRFQTSIRQQIQISLVIISVVSFVIVGLVTMLFYEKKFSKNSTDRYIKIITSIANNLNSSYKKSTDSTVSHYTETINTLANIQSSDINLYDSLGMLLTTTQPYIFNKKLVNATLHPTAYTRIFINKESLVEQDETIGKLKYKHFYKPIINASNNVVGCVGVPYINYRYDLNQELAGFIATLININALVFLLFGAIGILLTTWVTKPLKNISERFKNIKWTEEKYEQITWSKNDEIGALVKEYNSMVLKLNGTAKAFALSQKEKAWKEMAMQVAHEIKNPLTPMKLSIQYLQKNIEANASNIKELSASVVATLVEQIDQLSTIASDFSQFANISNAKAEEVNLNEVINNLVQLHATQTQYTLTAKFDEAKNIITADKVQINRLFTNLIKNAIEACSNQPNATIEIESITIDDKVIVSVTDNGTGIPAELQPKLFFVNFTTKTSGTGLGLAICKGIIENVNGKIWYETSSEGTKFFVEFPLLR